MSKYFVLAWLGIEVFQTFTLKSSQLGGILREIRFES